MHKINFTNAIHAKTLIRLTFNSKEDRSALIRLCAPLDFGPSSRAKNKDGRYHFWDFESDGKNHVLSLLPFQVVHMDFLTETFNPSDFICWECKWIIVRDWGVHS